MKRILFIVLIFATTVYATNSFDSLTTVTARDYNGSIIGSKYNENIYDAIWGVDVFCRYNGTGDFVAMGLGAQTSGGFCEAYNGDQYYSLSNGDIYFKANGNPSFVSLGQSLGGAGGMWASRSGNIYISIWGGGVFRQTAGTGNFNNTGAGTRNWQRGCCDTNNNVYVPVYNGDIYFQTNETGSFTGLGMGNHVWTDMDCTPENNVYVGISGTDLYMRTNGTGAFNALSQGTRQWRGIAAARNGNVYATTNQVGGIYLQNNVPKITGYSPSSVVDTIGQTGATLDATVINSPDSIVPISPLPAGKTIGALTGDISGDATGPVQALTEYYIRVWKGGNPVDTDTVSIGVTYRCAQCTLTVAAGDGGSVDPSGAQIDTCGDTLTIVALPDPGRRFVRWERSAVEMEIGDSTNDTTWVRKTDTTNATVTAIFDTVTYALVVTAGFGGTASGSGTYDSGTTVAIGYVVTNNDMVFDTWDSISGDFDFDGDSTHVVLRGNAEIQATFKIKAPDISMSETFLIESTTVAMSPITVTNNGGPGPFTVIPSFPTGLSISILAGKNGTISGTPTEVSAETEYLIISTNSTASDTAICTLTVVVGKPIVAYHRQLWRLIIGDKTSRDSLISTGGDIDSTRIDTTGGFDTLPDWLKLDSSTWAFYTDSVADTGSWSIQAISSNASGEMADTVSVISTFPRSAIRPKKGPFIGIGITTGR